MYLQVFYPWIKISKSIGDVLLKKNGVFMDFDAKTQRNVPKSSSCISLKKSQVSTPLSKACRNIFIFKKKN